jgi:hypothetical protein
MENGITKHRNGVNCQQITSVSSRPLIAPSPKPESPSSLTATQRYHSSMSLETLRTHRRTILELAVRHGARNVRVFWLDCSWRRETR